MSVSYDIYYKDYMGYKTNRHVTNQSGVFYSKYREQPIHKKYYYPIILTEIEGTSICSVSQDYMELCQSAFDGSPDAASSLLQSLGDSYYRRDMKRYVYERVDDQPKELDSIAVTATQSVLEGLTFEDVFDVDKYIQNNKVTMEQGRQFLVIEDNTIAARGLISDLYGKGGNIVVYTMPNYRNKGYGKEVVKACINWCVNHQILPIYFVEKENTHSIQLAESLGFIHKNDEIFIQKR